MQSVKPIELAFLSYAREDAEFVLGLAKDLRAGGADVWIDQLDIKPGQRWDRAIEDALAKCQQLLVILSPAAVESTNVMDEVSLALEEGKTVLPVIHRSCKVPFRLRRLQYVDLSLNYKAGVGRLLETLGVSVSSSEMREDAMDLPGSVDDDRGAEPTNSASHEIGNVVTAVLSAMLPAVFVATSVIALAFLIWLGINSLILADALHMPVPAADWLRRALMLNMVAPLVLSVITIVIYLGFEWTWHRGPKAEKPPSTSRMVVFHVVMSGLILVGICVGWYWFRLTSWFSEWPPSDANLWLWSTGISCGESGFSFSRHLFDAPMVWAVVALVVFVLRLVIMRFWKGSVSGKIVSILNRAFSRMLGAAVVVTALGFLWLVGCWLNCSNWGTKIPVGGALASGGALALLRNWNDRLEPAKKGGLMDMVKTLIAQILAYVAIALWAICIAAFLARWIDHGMSPWLLFAIALGMVVFAVLFFDPGQVSMHFFYRNYAPREREPITLDPGPR